MSCAPGRDGGAPDIAASFLKVRLRRDGSRVVGSCSQPSASVQPAMQQTEPGGDGASQLIARLNGKRSPACQPSACGYGAPPPDQRPRA
jgi:hypothetical protein